MAFAKFKSLVHHIIHECAQRPDQLGAIRLNKVLWFADVTTYKMDGKSITGEKYVKRKYGPVPSRILPALEELQRDGAVLILEPKIEYASRRFYSLAPPTGKLTNREKLITSAVLDDVLGRTASEISELSHDDVWDAAEIGEEIPMCATLASTPGEITEEVVEWANACLEQTADATAAAA